MQECGLSRGKLSMKIPELCPGKMHRHIDWLGMQRWLGHCNIRDNCEIRGLISPAKLWWRVFLGFLGLGWLSHRQIAPDEFKHLFMMMLLMPCDAFPSVPFPSFFSLFQTAQSILWSQHLIWPETTMHTHLSLLVAELVPRASKSSICTLHMPFKRWAMPRDAYTFGLKFGLKWPKRFWKKLCLATAQSSWCRFGSWMNFQCNCLAYKTKQWQVPS